MPWKSMSLWMFFGVSMLSGIVIGHTAKPQFLVEAYDPSVHVPDADYLPEDLRALRQTGMVRSDYIDESVKVMRSMKPLVKAGPFHIAWNPDTDDFWITLCDGSQTLVTQMKIHNKTELAFYAIGGERDMIIYEDRNSGELGVSYSASHVDNKGVPEVLWMYSDTNGDGKFDRLMDGRSGVLYEMNGLEWGIASERKNGK